MDIIKLEERQRMIEPFINAVYVYDDRLVFTFNYKDGTVNFDEIKETFGSDYCFFSTLISYPIA